MQEVRPSILIVEDERSIALLERRALEAAGYTVEIVDRGQSALQRLEHNDISLVLLDYRLPDMTGLDVIRAIGKRIESLPVVVVTGHGDERLAVEMLKLGVADYMAKTGEAGFIDALISTIGRAIESYRIKLECNILQRELAERDRMFREFFDSFPDPAFLWEKKNGRIELTEVNRQSMLLTSGGIAAKVGASREEFFTTHAGIVENIEQALNTGKPVREERFLTVPLIGENIWAIIDYVKFKPDGVLTVIKDITSRKKAEDELKDARKILESSVRARTVELNNINLRLQVEIEERKKTENVLREYQNAVESSNDLILVMDSDHRVVLANEAFLDHFNQKREAVIGSRGEDVFGRELFRTGFSEYIDACLQDRPVPPRDDIILRQADADNRHVQVAYYPIRGSGRKVASVVVVMKDITEQVRSGMSFKTFRMISDRAGYGVTIIDPEYNLIYVNEAFARMHGYTIEDLISKNLSIVFSHQQWEAFRIFNDKLLETGESHTDELWHKRKDGIFFPTMVTSSVIKGEKNEPDYISISVVDISQRKHDEEALQYSAEFERLITSISSRLINLPADEIDVGIEKSLGSISRFSGVDRAYLFRFYADGKKIDNTHEWCSEGMESQKRLRQRIIIDEELPFLAGLVRSSQVLHVPCVSELPEQAAIERGHLERLGVKSTLLMPMITRGTPFGFLGFDTVTSEKTWSESDITLFNIVGEIFVNALERKQAEERTKLSLQEKEILLKEIHHRVKNNLQIISSLLNLQASYLKEKPDRELFRESQNRVKSMALIHEKLYQSKDFISIDFCEYIQDLATNLFRSYKVDPNAITLDINVSGVQLEIDMAIPIGLIINELMTNSLKHAFPDQKTGEIKVDFRRHNGKEFRLSVSDSGIGMPENFNFREATSLGLQLVNTLADQLRGRLELYSEQGTRFEITFAQYKK